MAVIVGLAALAGGCATGLGGCGGDGDNRAERERTPRSALAGATPGTRARPRPRVRLVRLGGRFGQPVYVTQPPRERRRLFVVERTGRVKVIRDGRVLRRPFLSVRGRVSLRTEQGLLSLAFAPDYRRSRRLYYSYTDKWGNLRVVAARRSRRSPDRIDRSTRRVVMLVRQPASTHNGGHLAFGPDGLLYVGTGDGGGPGDPRRKGQNRASLLGKLLRIDPRATRRGRYRVPRSNPFTRVRGARDEIYAYGLRNPWRFAFDRRGRRLYIGDVGQERWEEIDAVSLRRAKGANFGWSAYEGRRRFNRRLRARGHVPPVHVYGRDQGCSIIGGHVVRDRALGRRLLGRYLYGDFCTGELRSLRMAGRRARALRSEHVRVPFLTSFGEDSRRRIYVTSLRGAVYRLRPAG